MTTKPIDDRQKKFLLIVPLLAIPFLALFFWALGGGKNASAQQKVQSTGLDMQLPGAKLKSDTMQNKLALYQRAEKDSLEFRQAAGNDPYYHGDTTKSVSSQDTVKKTDSGIIPRNGQMPTGLPFMRNGAATTSNSLAQNEQAVNQKLAMLQYQISHPAPATPADAGNGGTPTGTDEKLQQLQAQMQRLGNQNTDDPQMKQLNDMLDKIQDIQNPGLARQKMQEESEKHRGEVFAVSTSMKTDPVSTLDSSARLVHPSGASNGFYSLDNVPNDDDDQNTVDAVVAATQTLVNGSTVKLKLANDIYVNGHLIPQNTFIYGVAQLSGERLIVKIGSIRYKKSLYPVSLGVVDLDGMNGIYIPGAITRDVAKESADQGVQNLGLLGYDNSLGAQAASAGITAAKTLFSRKVRLIKVTVKAGYQVLLRDEKQKQFNQ